MEFISNPQLELAFDYARNTNKNIFLTGKAGTGKTTFLHQLKKEAVKRMVVVAPTGVAAINAKGMTIHSLFQLPFGVFYPGKKDDPSRKRKFRKEKINLIRSLDLLVIDEISMVRADLLDAVDQVLRRYRGGYEPFGGVQLLMIGDLHQLPPVVKNEEWDIMREYYDTPYFFGSQALRKGGLVTIELKHIYRQSDSTFINLLNKVRTNQVDNGVLDTLNSRYIPNFRPNEKEGYIILTSHNAAAQRTNNRKLAQIDAEVHKFEAEIKGDFPSYMYPTEEVLEMKVGAQVMFIKNDASYEKRYYNGKIGQITRIDDEVIYVVCSDDSTPIAVGKEEWDNTKYSLDSATKEVSEDVVGTFIQYPLKLAWAITIHKSQGLTFERAVIDAKLAFAHGQVYVALSRCKTFEGIVLQSKINYSSVKTDSVVRNYTEDATRNAPGKSDLLEAKKEFQQSLLRELFGFEAMKQAFNRLNRVFMEHEGSFVGSAPSDFKKLAILAAERIFNFAEKFQPILETYFFQTDLPTENGTLQQRIIKASAYFCQQLYNELLPKAREITIVTDNKAVREKAEDILNNLQLQIFIQNACFKAAKDGFIVKDYIRAKADAQMDFENDQRKAAVRAEFNKIRKNVPHPQLYAELVQWRNTTAVENGVEHYRILTTKSIQELVEKLPTVPQELIKIKGIGKSKVKQFGSAILEMIDRYCIENGISKTQNQISLDIAAPVKKSKRSQTKEVSLNLFKSGNDIDQIAKMRSLTRNTIEGHLAHFVSLGELDILELLPSGKINKIEAVFEEHPNASLSEIKDWLGENYSYGEIRLVLSYLKKENS